MSTVEDQLRTQIEKLYGLIDASALVISALEIDQVLQLVMEIAKRVVNAQACCLAILDEKTGLLGCEVALGEKGDEVKRKFSLKVGQGIAGWVAREAKSLLVPDVQKDERFFKGSDQQTGFVTRSILCVPILARGKVTGVIEVINPVQGGSFQETDLNLLTAFSSLASIAIENAKLTREIIEQKALEQELSIARQIQDNFLKKEFPPLTKMEGYAKTRSAHEIGGDFYDFLVLGKGRIGILIGDVSGRGIPAALYMVKTLSEFRLEAFSTPEIPHCLEKINDRLVKKSTMGMFVTLAYLVIDTKTGQTEMANAGHLPLYIYRGKEKKVEKLEGERGLPLGILLRSKISTQMLQFRPGDHVLLMTDGLIEAKNIQGEAFGWERFEKCFEEYSAGSNPKELVDGLFAELDRFGGHFAYSDDVTLVAVKIKE